MKNPIERLLWWLREKNQMPCECGSRDNHWKVNDTIAGHVCEAEVICDDCGKQVNYWSYGYCVYPETYTALIAEKVYRLRLWLRGKLLSNLPRLP